MFNLAVVLPAIGILLLVLFWFGRHHINHMLSGLWRDLQDFFWSMIDEPLDLAMDAFGVTAPIPWEPGDLWAAIRTYKKEFHVMGKFWAQVAAFECLAFGIEPVLEMAPGGSIVAAPIGWFFNVFPMVTVLRVVTRYKMKKAERGLHEIEGLAETEKELDLGVDKDLKTDEKGLHPLEHKGYWEDMNKWLAQTKTERAKAWRKIRRRINEELAVAADALATVAQEQQTVQQQLTVAQELLEPAEVAPLNQANMTITTQLQQVEQLIRAANQKVPDAGLLNGLMTLEPRDAIIALQLADDAINAAAAAEAELRALSQQTAQALASLDQEI